MKNRYYALLFLLCCFSANDFAEKYVDLDNYSVEDCSHARYQASQQNNLLDNLFRGINSTFTNEVSVEIIRTDVFWNTAKQFISTEHRGADIENDIQDFLAKTTIAGVRQIPVKYTTIDFNNHPLVLSGKIYLPSVGQPKGLIVANHYTIGSNKECPSNSFCLEGIFATNGYVVVMADYLGYGITVDSVHPYLHLGSVTKHVYDLLNSVMPYLCVIGQTPQTNNLYLLGYSQGAAITLGLQQMIERDGKFDITRVFAGAGPYSPSATYEYCVRNDYTGIPCAIPMLIQGMNIGEHLGLYLQDFFAEPLLSYYEQWINSKSYTMMEINDLIGYIPVSNILKPLALDTTLRPTKCLYRALQRNNIGDFTPHAPVYLFHSIDDDMVPFVNSELVQSSFQAQGLEHIVYDFGHYGNHMLGALEFFQRVYNQL